jgi:hypothetical protein
MLHVDYVLDVLALFHASEFKVGSGREWASTMWRALLLWTAPSGATTCFCLSDPRFFSSLRASGASIGDATLWKVLDTTKVLI